MKQARTRIEMYCDANEAYFEGHASHYHSLTPREKEYFKRTARDFATTIQFLEWHGAHYPQAHADLRGAARAWDRTARNYGFLEDVLTEPVFRDIPGLRREVREFFDILKKKAH
jgi:hypothetical protein